MTAYADVFERIEKKYLIDQEKMYRVETMLDSTHRTDDWGRMLVTSVYWDTAERSVIARSLEKPLYKEKIRARAYGKEAGEALVCAFQQWPYGENLSVEQESVCAFLELKKKYDGTVYKRRVALSLGALVNFVRGMSWEIAVSNFPLLDSDLQQSCQSPKSKQIAQEIGRALVRYGAQQLFPSVAISCWRHALAPYPNCEDTREMLRITFDEDIQYLDLICKNSQWLPVTQATVMEVKNVGPLDLEFSRFLSANEIFPRSFSKYGTAARLLAFSQKKAS